MSFQEAANAASKIQNFLDLVDRCRLVVSSAAEAEREEQAIRARIEPAKLELSGLQTKIDEQRSVLSLAQADTDAARQQAAEIVDEANRQASVKATELDVAATKQKSELQERSRAAKAEEELASAALAAVNAELVSARQELIDTRQRIAEAKAAAIAALA